MEVFCVRVMPSKVYTAFTLSHKTAYLEFKKINESSHCGRSFKKIFGIYLPLWYGKPFVKVQCLQLITQSIGHMPAGQSTTFLGFQTGNQRQIDETNTTLRHSSYDQLKNYRHIVTVTFTQISGFVVMQANKYFHFIMFKKL